MPCVCCCDTDVLNDGRSGLGLFSCLLNKFTLMFILSYEHIWPYRSLLTRVIISPSHITEQMFSSPPAPLLVCRYKCREMICCLLFDETGWHGNSASYIDRNKHRSVLVAAPRNRQNIFKNTPADTRSTHISKQREWPCLNARRQQHRADTRGPDAHIEGEMSNSSNSSLN